MPDLQRGSVTAVMICFSSTRWGDALGRTAPIAIVAALAPAHGCGAGVAECTLDGDCDQGQACELSECVLVCRANDDCSSEEVCLQGLTTERRVCQIAGAVNDTSSIRSRFAIVRDVTEGAGCDDTSPGADIAWVLAEDLDGDVVGWGNVVSAGISAEENSFPSYDHVDGQQPDGGADSCPEFQDINIVSLGCGGYLGVEFLDDAGEPVVLENGAQKLRVGEHGPQCDGGDGLDRYEVLLCPGVDDAEALPGACSISVGVGRGERAFAF